MAIVEVDWSAAWKLGRHVDEDDIIRLLLLFLRRLLWLGRFRA